MSYENEWMMKAGGEEERRMMSDEERTIRKEFLYEKLGLLLLIYKIRRC